MRITITKNKSGMDFPSYVTHEGSIKCLVGTGVRVKSLRVELKELIMLSGKRNLEKKNHI